MSIQSKLVAQFHRPVGPLGRVAGWIMSTRASNLERNRWTLDLLDIQPEDVVCELGPGPGVTLARILEKARHAIAVDHSPLMLERCRVRNRRAIREGRLVLYEADFEHLPDIGGVDKILAVNSLQFDAMHAQALRCIGARLKAGGKLAVTFQPRGKAPTEADVDRAARKMSDELSAAGFVDLALHRLALAPVSAVCIIANRGSAG